MNANVLFDNVADNRELWLIARAGRIGSSDAVTACGLNPYKSPFELWCELTDKVPVDNQDSPEMMFGRAMESAVGKLFQARFPSFDVTPNNKTFSHPDNEKFIATPDCFLRVNVADDSEVEHGDGEGLLEIKTSRSTHGWEDGIPDYAHIQIMWQMAVMGLSWGYVAGLLKGNPSDLRAHYVAFDESVWNQIQERVSSFLELVKKDLPPNPGPADSALIESVVKRQKGKEIALDDSAYEHTEKLKEAQLTMKDLNQELKHWDEQKKAAENALKLALGDADSGALPNGSVVKVTTVQVNERFQSAFSYTRVKLQEPKDEKKN